MEALNRPAYISKKSASNSSKKIVGNLYLFANETSNEGGGIGTFGQNLYLKEI